jgi:hypothetical protein
MSENNKTLTFVASAVVLLLAAWMLRPAPASIERQNDIGQEFFPDFKDPNTATSLEVVEYDEASGGLRPFKVAQVNGVWSIPSHEGYPADAKNQLEQAAAAMIGLEKLSMVSESPKDQETYGVVDPDASKLEAGAAGVGKRVTLEDKSGNVLSQLIIGKKDPDRPELHYVRVPGQDRIYRAVVKTDKLSTKFQNWIEEDLLKLNAFDVKQVVMDDHSVDELNQRLIQRGLTVVDFNNKDSKWTLEKMEASDPATGKWEEVTLKDDEELDTQKLNDLKTALDDLKIVDVRHKPAGLSKDLKAGEELVADRATRQALQQRGFYLAPVEGGFALFSNEGEVRCGLNDGVEYILRFGEIAGQSTNDDEDDKSAEKKEGEAEDAAKDPAKADEKKEDKDKGVDRYIMVTAQFRPDLIPKPELQPLPEGYEEFEDKPAEGAEAKQPAEAKPAEADAKPADATEAKPAAEAPKEEAAPAEAAKEAPQNESSRFAPGDEYLLAFADDAAAAIELAQAPAAAQENAAPAAAGTADAQPAAEAPAETKPAAPVDPDAAAEAEEKARAAKRAEIKRIKEENKRKEDEYNKKIADGEKRVKELNERFADWYYVISDGTYKKIHISRDQVIKKKTEPAKPAGEGNGPLDLDALKNLQGPPQGLPK